MPMPSAYETRSEAFFRLYEGETPQEIQTLLTRWIPKGSRVLELACGSSRDARFDAVYTCGVLQHLSDHELYEGACFMERAVTDKGTLIVVVPLDHKGDPDRKTFLRDSLDYATLFERMGFRLASQEIRDGVGSPGHECR